MSLPQEGIGVSTSSAAAPAAACRPASLWRYGALFVLAQQSLVYEGIHVYVYVCGLFLFGHGEWEGMTAFVAWVI